MSRSPTATDAALTCIASANLTPTEHLLLKDLIENAVEPNDMATYILQRIAEDPSRRTEQSLRLLKEDWRSLASKRKFPPPTYLIV